MVTVISYLLQGNDNFWSRLSQIDQISEHKISFASQKCYIVLIKGIKKRKNCLKKTKASVLTLFLQMLSHRFLGCSKNILWNFLLRKVGSMTFGRQNCMVWKLWENICGAFRFVSDVVFILGDLKHLPSFLTKIALDEIPKHLFRKGFDGVFWNKNAGRRQIEAEESIESFASISAVVVKILIKSQRWEDPALPPNGVRVNTLYLGGHGVRRL